MPGKKENKPYEFKSEDIFMEAAKQTINRTITIKEENITEHNIGLPTTKKSRKHWDGLKKEIEEGHADRFNKILEELPDREFVRVYLKALEFFKPKIVRQTGGKKEEPDTTINVQINYGSNDKKINS
jgi:hypothetical protein